jgi:inosine-uridine nucleoside N-ribohydrolase
MTTRNSLKICSLSGLSHIKVYKGAARPLMRPADLKDGIEFHGAEGLGRGVFVPDPIYSHEEGSAIFHMYT